MRLALATAQQQPDQLGGIAGWAVGVMETLGLVGAAFLIAIENLFPPLPSEVILPLAGFAASRGEFSLVGALVATTIGSVVGAVVLYWIGRRFGEDRIRRWAEKLPLFKVRDIDRANEWFRRHGKKAVFFGRMLPVFRSVISVPAGVERMPAHTFVLLTAAGSAIWNGVFIVAGYYLGESWSAVEPIASVLQWVVLAAIVAACGYFVVRRTRQARAARRS